MKHSHDPPRVIEVIKPEQGEYWIWDAKQEVFFLLDESRLARASPNFYNLNEQGRKKAYKMYLENCTMIKTAKMPAQLANAHKKLRDGVGRKCSITTNNYQIGAHVLLLVCVLFSNVEVSCDLLATILAGMRCEELRKATPDFRAVVEVNSTAPEIEETFIVLVQAIVTRKRWKKRRIKRRAVLDYRTKPGDLPNHIQDFSRLKIKAKRYPALWIPVPYTDTVALVIGADSAKLREAMPYLENAAVFLLNCGNNDLGGRKLRASALSEYDPEVVKRLKEERHSVAALLRAWWKREDAEATWAQQIVAKAKASFGKPDSRYISVQLDPKLLNKAIRYQVLCSFLDWLDVRGFLAAEELEYYREVAKGVYDPEPVEEMPPQHAEDPKVFLRIMRALVTSEQIAGPDEPVHKGDKLLGAWRTISGECFLVMPEAGWKKAYSKAARTGKDVDITFFRRDKWERDLQKILSEAEVIKVPSVGYRYRYDLYGTGERDSTYVVAVPAKLLTEQ